MVPPSGILSLTRWQRFGLLAQLLQLFGNRLTSEKCTRIAGTRIECIPFALGRAMVEHGHRDDQPGDG